MFGGLGKLVGGALKAVGLGKLAPFVSMGVNLFTGNIAGLATDIMGLMSNIKGLGFLNKVAQFAPLGGFGGGNGSGGFGGFTDLLKPGRLRDIADKFTKLADSLTDFRASAQKVDDMFRLLRETMDNREALQAARDHAYYTSQSRINA